MFMLLLILPVTLLCRLVLQEKLSDNPERAAHVWVTAKVYWGENRVGVYRHVYYFFDGQAFEVFDSSYSFVDFLMRLNSLDLPDGLKQEVRTLGFNTYYAREFASELEKLNLSSKNKKAILQARVGKFPTVDDVLKAVRRWRLAHGSE